MAAPVRSPNPRQSEVEAEVILAVLAVCMAVGGLAKWAERNATVRAMLDGLTMPVVQVIAAYSPGFDHFLRQAQPFTWFIIQSVILVMPLALCVGFWRLLTAEARQLRREASKQLFLKRRNERLRKVTEEMEAKEEGKPTAGGNGWPGEAATDAERLRDVFGKQPPEPSEGIKGFSLFHWFRRIF